MSLPSPTPMKISKRIAFAGLPPHAARHGRMQARRAAGVAGFIRLGYISDNAATLVDGIGKILAFGDTPARGLQ
ncbi:hypothetical protein [Massilia sp. S19_KUP03_FR1]|uniref:hypothetical protein n=1 Tax=Massilia sp. S19_KUP03_FR1 TaxID=3025503 RepID=UPI002FCD8BFB